MDEGEKDVVSPYSILNKTGENDIEKSILDCDQLARNYGGARSTRAEILKNIHLKQKLGKSPRLGRITRQQADKMALDPLTNSKAIE